MVRVSLSFAREFWPRGNLLGAHFCCGRQRSPTSASGARSRMGDNFIDYDRLRAFDAKAFEATTPFPWHNMLGFLRRAHSKSYSRRSRRWSCSSGTTTLRASTASARTIATTLPMRVPSITARTRQAWFAKPSCPPPGSGSWTSCGRAGSITTSSAAPSGSRRSRCAALGTSARGDRRSRRISMRRRSSAPTFSISTPARNGTPTGAARRWCWAAGGPRR